ncbi:hypothetical protein L9F63_008813, partial [Diploptera punctata]
YNFPILLITVRSAGFRTGRRVAEFDHQLHSSNLHNLINMVSYIWLSCNF